MTSTGYAAPVAISDEQRERLHAAHAAIADAEAAAERAEQARNAVLRELAERKYGATAMADALNVEPRPWSRPVSRVNLQTKIGPATEYRSLAQRRTRLPVADAERLRAAHLALHEAGNAAEDAIAARAALFVELYQAGVPVTDMRAALTVSKGTVQVPITRHYAGTTGRPRRNPRRA